jgi:tetratricopeptide (TPR) repeat protein
MMGLKGLLFILMGELISVTAFAVDQRATDSEIASLPPYCAVKLKANPASPEYQLWGQTLGPDFQHTHHYCFGLLDIMHYYRSRTAQDKRFHLQNAMGNLSYMVNHAQPTYSLMPDVYLNRGLVFSLQGRNAEAVQDMSKALELNPRLPKAYSALADYYAGINMKDRALETIKNGLRYNPDTTSLQRRYRELGGKLPYPEPIKTSADEISQPATPEIGSSRKAEGVMESAKPEPVTKEINSPTEPVKEQPIGSPKSPYCRFCPD